MRANHCDSPRAPAAPDFAPLVRRFLRRRLVIGRLLLGQNDRRSFGSSVYGLCLHCCPNTLQDILEKSVRELGAISRFIQKPLL